MAKKKSFKLRRERGPYVYVALALIMFVVIILLAWLSVSVPQIQLISYNYTTSLSAGGSLVFRLPTTSTPFVLYLKNSSKSADVFYLSPVPILAGETQEFTMPNNSLVNISTTGSNIADLQIRRIQGSANETRLTILVLQRSLGIGADGGIVVINNTIS